MAFPTRFPYNASRAITIDGLRTRLRRRLSTADFTVLHLRSVRFPVRHHRWSGNASSPRYWRELVRASGELSRIVREFNNNGAYPREVVEAIEELMCYAPGGYIHSLVPRIQDALNGSAIVLADCGHVCEDGDEIYAHDRQTYCQECSDEYLRHPVEDDDNLYHRNDLYFWESDDEYHLEEEPEEDEDEDDEDEDGLYGWSASTTHLDHDRNLMRSASPTGEFGIGVEVEVESARGQLRAAIASTQSHFGGSDSSYAMLKKDGSLGCHGFEIVTAARDVQDHVKKFASWKPHGSLTSWANGNCGMHVHLDSKAFTALTLGKFLQFFNDRGNYAFIKSIAGRHPMDGGKAETYCQMSAANGKITAQVSGPSKAKTMDAVAHYSRYRMVNLTNLGYNEMQRLGVRVDRDSKDGKSTVELRIFKGTLKKERLLAQIEFAHASLLFCRAAAWHQLTGDSFMAWLRTGDAAQYRNLRRWFGVTTVNPKPSTTTTKASTAEV